MRETNVTEDRRPAARRETAAFATASAALAALSGAAAELRLGDRRYRLTVESVFRLEEIDGGFVFFLRNAGALQRRVGALAAAAEPGVRLRGAAFAAGRDN